MLSGIRAFKLGQGEQQFHQDLGIDGARPRFEDEAYVLGRFIAHVGEQRQLFLANQFGRSFRGAWDFCTR